MPYYIYYTKSVPYDVYYIKSVPYYVYYTKAVPYFVYKVTKHRTFKNDSKNDSERARAYDTLSLLKKKMTKIKTVKNGSAGHVCAPCR